MADKSQKRSGSFVKGLWLVFVLLLGVNLLNLLNGDLFSAWSQDRRGTGGLSQFNLEKLALPKDEILAGGPPKDGIPALTDPDVVSLDDIKYDKDTRVVVVNLKNQVRAYPLNILNWHEIVNDTVAGVPLVVVYCPLCDSVSVMQRQIKDKVFEFGVSGLLHQSNVLLYDRQDQALWSQIKFVAVSGPHVNEGLAHLPWHLTTFAELQKKYPAATVLSEKTGHSRNYKRNPYASYFSSPELMFPVGKADARLPNKERVIGVLVGKYAVAYPVKLIQQAEGRLLQDKIQGEELILQADASGGVEVKQMPANARIIHAFWFSWAAFHPGTRIYNEK